MSELCCCDLNANERLAKADADRSSLIAALRALEQEIEKLLTRLDAECFTVDVREKHGTNTPVIDTVVKRSDALHWLLFLRSDVKKALGEDRLSSRRKDVADAR